LKAQNIDELEELELFRNVQLNWQSLKRMAINSEKSQDKVCKRFNADFFSHHSIYGYALSVSKNGADSYFLDCVCLGLKDKTLLGHKA
jgi:hypothetical protein